MDYLFKYLSYEIYHIMTPLVVHIRENIYFFLFLCNLPKNRRMVINRIIAASFTLTFNGKFTMSTDFSTCFYVQTKSAQMKSTLQLNLTELNILCHSWSSKYLNFPTRLHEDKFNCAWQIMTLQRSLFTGRRLAGDWRPRKGIGPSSGLRFTVRGPATGVQLLQGHR